MPSRKDLERASKSAQVVLNLSSGSGQTEQTPRVRKALAYINAWDSAETYRKNNLEVPATLAADLAPAYKEFMEE